MKAAVILGSRADSSGQLEIARSLKKQGAEVRLHLTGHVKAVDFGEEFPADIGCCLGRPDVAVCLGDRHEIVQCALEYREAGVPIAHIHAGEVTGQEPDDTYRFLISRMATWCFTPQEDYLTMCSVAIGKENAGVYKFGMKYFNCGSPFITSAHKTELIDVEWPEGKGLKLFVAFNPLPENEDETEAIALEMESFMQYRSVAVGPNTDKNRDSISSAINCYTQKVVASLMHQEYLSYLKSADIIVGNSSSPLIENCVFGTPYINVGSRNKYRVAGPHVTNCEPDEVLTVIADTDLRKKPSDTYGGKESSDNIASTLIREFNEQS